MFGRGALYRTTEPGRVLWAMTGAHAGRRLFRDAALARVHVDALRGEPHGRTLQDAQGLLAPLVCRGGARRERVRAAAWRGAFAGGAAGAGAGAGRVTASSVPGRTAAGLAPAGVGAPAAERCRAARALLEVVSVHARPVAGGDQFRAGDARRPGRAAARPLDARATERDRRAGDGSRRAGAVGGPGHRQREADRCRGAP